MANKIILKRSSVASKAPLSSDLDYGELSINYTDGTLYYKNSGGSISTIGSNIGNTVVSGNITANTAGTRAIFANVITTNGIFWANGSAYSAGGGTYANADVQVYLESLFSVNIGANSGLSNQSSQAVAIGSNAGQTTQCARAIAVGYNAGKCLQNSDAVAIGTSAGKTSQGLNAIAVGKTAGQTSQGASSISIGNTAGNVSQGSGAIAIGTGAGSSTQGIQAVAIGDHAGCSGQSASAVAIGDCAAASSQGGSAVAIGPGAGNCHQAASAVAVGNAAGNYQQGSYGVAVGYLSGHCAQGSSAVAIGRCAGFGCQAANAVAIGYNAGQYSQGANAIAIGRNAGVTGQVANSIAINASGTALDPANAGFYVDPVRSATGSNVVVYNTTTKELTYTTLPSSYSNSNVESYIGANIGAYQTYANAAIQTLSANIGTLVAGAPGALDTLLELGNALGNSGSFSSTMVTWLGNITSNVTAANTSISTLNANLGTYQIYANANIGTLYNANISTNANLGAFETYANSKIGTNTNSNLVVVATTTSTNTTTGALVVQGGAGISGALNVGGNSIAPSVYIAGGTNLLRYSQQPDFGNPWALSSVTAAGNTAVAPDGTTTAATITMSAGAGITKYYYQNPNIVPVYYTYTGSIYVKANAANPENTVVIRISDNTTSNSAWSTFNISSGTYSTTGTAGSVYSGYGNIVAAANGWYRCSSTVTFTQPMAGTLFSVFGNGYGATSATGSFYVWGAQVEPGSTVTTYVPTTSSAIQTPNYLYATGANIVGPVNFTGPASISTNTGALVVAGGAGVAGNLNVGGTYANLSTGGGSFIAVTGSTPSGGVSTVKISGIDSSGPNGNVVHVQYGAQNGGSHSFRTGASQLEMVRISQTSGAVNYLNLTGSATGNAPSVSAFGTDANIDLSLVATGTGNITTSNPVRITNANVSTSTNTGALIVAGGTGIAGNLNVGGNVNVAGNITLANIILPDNSYISTATVYDLDDISYATDGFTNSFRPTYNQNTVTITNPWQLLVTVDGAVQPAFDNNYDTIWFGLALTASRGYTVDTTGNIKFADCPAQGSSIMARTVVGSPNPTKKVYPFKPLDILLGS